MTTEVIFWILFVVVSSAIWITIPVLIIFPNAFSWLRMGLFPSKNGATQSADVRGPATWLPPTHTGETDCVCGCMNQPTPSKNISAAALPLRDMIITGYRTYNIAWKDGRPVLQGRQVPWPTRRLVANCGGDEGLCSRHLATLWDDGCGIYAYKAERVADPGVVAARCVMYGVVWPHTHGYRATHVRIEHLTYYALSQDPDPLEEELTELLSTLYEVPCAIVPRPVAPSDPFPTINPSGPFITSGRSGPSYVSPPALPHWRS